jgi:hypothetical protein
LTHPLPPYETYRPRRPFAQEDAAGRGGGKSYIAYEYAEPEVRRLLVQVAFDKLWVVGDKITGADLKAGYVTLLDDDLHPA